MVFPVSSPLRLFLSVTTLVDGVSKPRIFYAIFKGHAESLADSKHSNGGRQRRQRILQVHRVTSRAPFLELDFFMHKSNSTYPSDLDYARGYILSRIFGPSLGASAWTVWARAFRADLPMPYLAGVAFSFRKGILGYSRYSIVTRILDWDDKWIWLVSYFTRPSKPTSTLKLTLTSKSKKVLATGQDHLDSEKEALASISASASGSEVLTCAVSKVVFKQYGRTVSPAEMFTRAGLGNDLDLLSHSQPAAAQMEIRKAITAHREDLAWLMENFRSVIE